MARKAKAYVLDSWSVMAYLEDEPAGTQVADLVADVREENIPLLMSVVNAAEVWYLLARQTSEADAEQSITELQQMGIEMIDADWELAHQAAAFKSKYKMSLADCFAAALAKANKAELVTGDKEFKQVESQLKVHWL